MSAAVGTFRAQEAKGRYRKAIHIVLSQKLLLHMLR